MFRIAPFLFLAFAAVCLQGFAQAEGNKIKIRTGKDEMEIEVTSKKAFPAIGAIPVLHIGAQKTLISGYPKGELTTLVFKMPKADFGKTQSGDPISVRYDPDSQGKWDFGTLDKKTVDK
jgi:hypothetical protein